MFSNGGRCFRIDGTGHGGRVAQLGEHLLCKQGVAGSNPVTSTKLSLILKRKKISRIRSALSVCQILGAAGTERTLASTMRCAPMDFLAMV